MVPWSDRFREFVGLLPSGYSVCVSEDEWKVQCTGSQWCPPILCIMHDTITTTTTVSSIKQGNGVGCLKCCHVLDFWKDRYSEFVEILPSGYTVQITEDEWQRQCDGAKFCPPIRCNAHGTTTTTTAINMIQQGHGVGCIQCVPLLARKTEATVLQWLESAFPAASIAREVSGPVNTRFDFVLEFGRASCRERV